MSAAPYVACYRSRASWSSQRFPAVSFTMLHNTGGLVPGLIAGVAKAPPTVTCANFPQAKSGVCPRLTFTQASFQAPAVGYFPVIGCHRRTASRPERWHARDMPVGLAGLESGPTQASILKGCRVLARATAPRRAETCRTSTLLFRSARLNAMPPVFRHLVVLHGGCVIPTISVGCEEHPTLRLLRIGLAAKIIGP
jgi:hypothetical protein